MMGAPHTAAFPESELSRPPVRILYMEDDAGLARLFQKHLERSGYEVDLAPDGSSGLALYREGTYDVLAVDYKMPVQDGLAVIRELSEEGRVPPTIMLTANGDEALAVEALKLGASDYIVKDTAGGYIRLLPSVIERLLETHRLQEARRRDQEKLRRSEERLRQITSSAKDAIVSINQQGEILLWNRSAREVFGLTEDEALGRRFVDLLVPKHQESLREGLEHCRAGEQRVLEIEVLHRRGHRVPVEASLSCSDPEGEILYTCILRDITDRLRTQTALQEAARLEATATLAAGIAHQFNNLLFGVLGNTELLQMRLDDRPDAIGRLDMIRHQAERATGLVEQLLAFARRGQYQPVILDVNDVAAKVLAEEEVGLAPEVTVERQLAPNLWRVSADPTQLAQVMANLFSNAVEALEGPGRIVLKTENSTQISGVPRKSGKQDDPTQGRLSAGRYVLLRVTDDGQGMNRETLSNVYTPFFTTKFQGRGLGMAAVWGIVQNHGGRIDIESAQGRGTEVRVYLPALDPQTGTKPPPRPAASVPRGTETVLVVDPEEITRTVAQEFLDVLGYRTLVARNGEEAVAMARDHQGDLHLALLDLNLSTPSSREVFPRLIEARPGVRIILSSGRQDDPLSRELLAAGASAYLHKPFGLELLAYEIRRILDAP